MKAKNNTPLERHIEYLKHSGIDMSEYTAIVIEDGGKRIVRLSDWRAK